MTILSRLVEAVGGRVTGWDLPTAAARGMSLGRLAYRLDRRHRQVALSNLRRAFPDRDDAWHVRTTRGSFEQMGRTALELLWSPQLVNRPVEEIIRTDDNMAYFNEVLEAGNGAIIATAHFGNWELMGVALAKLGVPLISIARPLDDAGLDRLVTKLRTCTGARVLPKRNAFRPALRELRSGSVLAILVDQNTLPPDAVFVPYFDRLAATTPAVAQLHLRSGAPIFPMFAVPCDDHYRLAIDSPITDARVAQDEAILEITAAITASIERHVRARPEAWLWMHDRWRRRP